MKTTFPEDRLPGWAMPEAAALYWFVFSELLWLGRHGENLPFQMNSYKMKAFCWKAYNDMARKADANHKDNKPKLETFTKRDPIRWVNLSLSDDDSLRLSEIDTTIDSLSADFVALVLEGWDISLKRQSKDGSYSATAICDDPHVTNGGVGLSGWSDNPVDALTSLLYKLKFKLDGGLPLPEDRPSRRFR